MKYSILFFGRKNCKYSNHLKKKLKQHSNNLIVIESEKIAESIIEEKIKKKKIDYIICFRSFIIIKKKLLKMAKIAAINFHPGTPKYRGIGCVNFALYNNEKVFGSTAHLINEKIDNGKIIDVKYFKIKKNNNLTECLNKTHKIMLKQAKVLLKIIFSDTEKLDILIKNNKIIKWSKILYKRTDLDNLYKINQNINKNKLEVIKRATLYKNFKPYILLHNNKFTLNDKN